LIPAFRANRECERAGRRGTRSFTLAVQQNPLPHPPRRPRRKSDYSFAPDPYALVCFLTSEPASVDLSPLRPFLLRNGRAALLLVVVACLTPERASAGCGNHDGVFHDPLIAIDQQQTALPDDPTPTTPCQGPNCSRRQSPDAPPPATAPITPQATEAVIDSRAVLSEGSRSTFPCDFSSPRPVRRTSSIFHPPRHV
jgi:hypothetical protein